MIGGTGGIGGIWKGHMGQRKGYSEDMGGETRRDIGADIKGYGDIGNI